MIHRNDILKSYINNVELAHKLGLHYDGSAEILSVLLDMRDLMLGEGGPPPLGPTMPDGSIISPIQIHPKPPPQPV